MPSYVMQHRRLARKRRLLTTKERLLLRRAMSIARVRGIPRVYVEVHPSLISIKAVPAFPLARCCKIVDDALRLGDEEHMLTVEACRREEPLQWFYVLVHGNKPLLDMLTTVSYDHDDKRLSSGCACQAHAMTAEEVQRGLLDKWLETEQDVPCSAPPPRAAYARNAMHP